MVLHVFNGTMEEIAADGMAVWGGDFKRYDINTCIPFSLLNFQNFECL